MVARDIWVNTARLARQVLAAGVLALTASSVALTPAVAQKHVINLKDAEINAFIQDVSAVTGYTFIVHPEVRGRVTVTSQVPLEREEVFDVFLSTLRVQGYAAIPTSNGAYRIVPDSLAKETAASDDYRRPDQSDDQFTTQVVQLRYFDAVEAAKMVKPLVNPRGSVTANANSNVIVLVDYAGNIDRVRRVVTELDQDRSVISTIPLQNVSADEMQRVVNSLNSNRRGGEGELTGNFSAVAMESGNALVVRGDRAAVARVKQVVSDLDAQSRPSANTRVVFLKHAQAADIVPILEQVARSMGENRPVGEDGVALETIPFDAATNALILSADVNTLAAMERVIKELDIRRAQVLVEAIIVELSDSAARELGLQFFLSGTGNSSIPFAATNFSQSAPNLLAAAGALLVDDDDASDVGDGGGTLAEIALSSLLAQEGGLIGGAGQDGDAIFGVILNALQDDVNSNILSTPSIMTLDNEAASIIVGQEIPITTGEALGNNNSNPFRTIERKDVGVQLEVTPQIGEGDVIKLDLRQEVSSVSGPVSLANTELITNTREIDTTVLADDGEVIVLGGLIEERETGTQTKVPFLGDIPIAGRAFRNEGTQKEKTNLMVFIRPSIIRSDIDARAATNKQYNLIRDAKAVEGEETTVIDFTNRVLGPGLK